MWSRQITRKPRTVQQQQFIAPVAGWLSNRALAAPEGSPGAAVLDNFFPRAGSVKLRRGRQIHATLASTSLPVLAMFSYRNGNNEHMFAANETAISDVTTNTAVQVMAAFTSADWSTVQFATTGGVYLIGVNGQDTGFIYDGTNFWPNASGGVRRLNYDAETVDFVTAQTVTGGTSGATGTVYQVVAQTGTTGYLVLTNVAGTFTDNETLTGSIAGSATVNGAATVLSPGITFPGSLTIADMSFVWVYKNRLWFIQKDSLNAYYMPVDQIGGSATAFPLAGVLGLGGSLLFGQGWSLGTSEQGGLGEQNVFVSTQGEIAIYQGVDPGIADDWSKVGVYRIGTPLGKRAFFRGGGDLAIATSVGLVPLSKAIELDVTSLNVGTVSYPIADAWDTATSLRGLEDWVCELWPEEKMAIVSPPDLIGSSEPVLFVSNTETGAWARYTGWYALSMEVFRGELYFGTTAGQVFQANVSGMDGANSYTGICMSLHEDLGSPGARKVANVARAVTRAAIKTNGKISASFDFNLTVPPPPNATANGSGSFWGTGVWGVSVWAQGTPSVMNQVWRSVGGLGYTVAPCYQVTSGSVIPIDEELISMQLDYLTTEIVG